MEKLELPHSGIVYKIGILNITDFLDFFKESRPFEVLGILESQVVLKKIRKIEENISIPYTKVSGEQGMVIFSLSSFNKIPDESNIEAGIDRYFVVYRYSTMI